MMKFESAGLVTLLGDDTLAAHSHRIAQQSPTGGKKGKGGVLCCKCCVIRVFFFNTGEATILKLGSALSQHQNVSFSVKCLV